MKIAYFGLPLGALRLFREGFAVGPVILAPVPAPGRRRLSRELPGVARVDFLEGGQDADVERVLAANPPDVILSWFWTRRLPLRWLEAARNGGFNVHPSLLPRHRGPNPYFAAIDAGDAETGVTLHRIDASYDTGPIVLCERIDTGDRDAWQLARALDRPSLRLLVAGARLLASGGVIPLEPQSSEQVTWAGEPEGEALRVDWRWPTERVLRRLRALSPVPGLALEIHGLRFFATRAVATTPPPIALEPGEAAAHGGWVRIRTSDGAIAITRAVLADSETELEAAELASLVAERAPILQDQGEKPNGRES